MLKKLLAIILIGLGSITAQTFSGKINPFPVYSPGKVAADSLRILAVMVNFVEDRDASTFGSGKFGTNYSKDYGNAILDPLPHNKNYFESHLEFAKNYFRKVSGDKLNITCTVLPDTFSVSKPMRSYSPAGSSQDFTLLADFASEVWTMADQLNPGFNFSDYDIFLIFHAGVGRDISLPGSLGNERDLPSLYLGENGLKKIRGNDFPGFPVSGGNFFIKNSMIIPETESRELSSFGTTVLFEITINGLITASIASHLGLPDLFDTKTGLSAIGRFGLMDGQAIFAYSGLFPPEPSPWEKIYLGWAEPVVISPGNYNLSVTAKSAAGISDTVILKIPISSSEYYLVENRNRDAANNGAILTLLQGKLTTKVFKKDTAGFYSFAVDSIDGVLVDIDDFEWALPGLIDDTATYKGGIVVWHIDENVIASKIAQNEINTDKNNRGVDIEEADGIQDIGEKFTTIFGDELIGEGSYEDYWYSDNPATLYLNRFGIDTRPKSITNTGANTLITMRSFSSISNKMTFDLVYGDSLVKPIFSTVIENTTPGQTTLSKNENNSFNILLGTTLLNVNAAGIPDNVFNAFSESKPVSFIADNIEFTVGTSDSSLKIVENGNILRTINVGAHITSSLTLVKGDDGVNIIFGTASGNEKKVVIYVYDNTNPDKFRFDSSTGTDTVTHIAAADVSNYFFAETNGTGYRIQFGNYSGEGKVLQLSLTKRRDGSFLVIVLSDKELFTLSDNRKELSDNRKELSIVNNTGITSFAVADLKNDGENYIIFNSGDKVNAINLSGANAEGFPFTDPLGRNFTGTPLAADFSGDSRSEVISFTEDGRIFALNGADGTVVNSFPISAGKMVKTSALYVFNGKASLALIDSTGHFYGWNIGPTEGRFFWSEENGNNKNTSFVNTAASGNFVNTFFPEDKVYNYPNPVYGSETAIRYYVAENSKINVMIFDLAGDFVAELNGNANGGFENELLWNVSSIQSGIYLARVEATGDSGKKEQSIIKIAIVK